MVFFIDGMDEFYSKPSDLIDLVSRLIVPGVKVCASSRPWNQFEDAFGHGPHLRIERLTRRDIETNVASKLSSSSAFLLYEQSDPGTTVRLIDDVCEKSHGVFLWIYLVCKSLLDGLADGEKRTELQLRLSGLPTDLEALFEKILGTLDTAHAERTSAMLQIHKLWSQARQHNNGVDIREYRPAPTLLGMFHADEDDPDYTVKARCNPSNLVELRSRVELMHRRLNACTKGLLEADVHNAKELWLAEVTLLHRTVKDYLDRQGVWANILAKSPPQFNCNLRICNSSIMHVKARDPLYTVPSWDLCDITSCAAEDVFRLRKTDAAVAGELLTALDQAHADLASAQLFNAGKLANLARSDIRQFRQECETSLETAIFCSTFEYVRRKLEILP